VSIRIEQQIEALLDALKISEQEEKKRYNAAIDIEDMAEATAVTIDARTKIQQLRKWTEDVLAIKKEILSSSFSTELPDAATSPAPSIQEPEQNRIPDGETEDIPSDGSSSLNAGEYVRQKLHQLSKSGFSFSEEQLSNIQNYRWCRNNLRLPHPLARIYDASVSLQVIQRIVPRTLVPQAVAVLEGVYLTIFVFQIIYVLNLHRKFASGCK